MGNIERNYLEKTLLQEQQLPAIEWTSELRFRFLFAPIYHTSMQHGPVIPTSTSRSSLASSLTRLVTARLKGAARRFSALTCNLLDFLPRSVGKIARICVSGRRHDEMLAPKGYLFLDEHW